MNRRERGAALLMAMAIMAFAAIASTAMLVSLSTWSRQAGLVADHAQAQELLSAGDDWVRAMLSDDRRASGDVDHAGEPWALRLPPIPFENGELAGTSRTSKVCSTSTTWCATASSTSPSTHAFSAC